MATPLPQQTPTFHCRVCIFDILLTIILCFPKSTPTLLMTSMITLVSNEIILFQFSMKNFSATVTELQRKIIYYPSANLESLIKFHPKMIPRSRRDCV